MKEKIMINFLVALIIIVLIIIGFKTIERVNKDYAMQKEADLSKGDDEQELPQAKPEDLAEEAEEESLTGGGGAGGAEGIGNRTDLPLDLYTQPCSFYFSEYGVCAGTCPSGTCTQEGQSCYCRED